MIWHKKSWATVRFPIFWLLSIRFKFQHCFYDFCKQTILHGWHYLADLESDTESGDEEAGGPPSRHSTPDLRVTTPSPVHRHTYIDRSTNTVNQVNHFLLFLECSNSGKSHVAASETICRTKVTDVDLNWCFEITTFLKRVLYKRSVSFSCLSPRTT